MPEETKTKANVASSPTTSLQYRSQPGFLRQAASVPLKVLAPKSATSSISLTVERGGGGGEGRGRGGGQKKQGNQGAQNKGHRSKFLRYEYDSTGKESLSLFFDVSDESDSEELVGLPFVSENRRASVTPCR